MAYTDRTEYFDPVANQIKTGADAIWALDAEGNATGLVGPDGTTASALTAHAAEHAEMGVGIEIPGSVGSSSIGINLLDFSTLTGYSATAGATIELVSASVPQIGKVGNSIKMTVPAGTTKSLDLASFSAVNIANKAITLVYENLTPENNATSVWYMAVENALTNHYYTSFSLNKYGLAVTKSANDGTRNQWVTGGGAPTFSTLTDGRINVTAAAGNDAVVVFHGIYASSVSLPIITFIQDDGVVSGYTELLPLLLNYGWKAGFSIIADLIGTGGYLTESQLSLLYKAGNDLVPHGQYALSSYATPELAIADIDYNSTYLTSRGYTRVAPVYVYPNGVQHFSSAYPSQIKQHLESSGYEAAFLASGYLNGAIGGIGKFDIPRYAINASVNTATAIEYLNLAVASRQSMTFMLHSIVASGASGDHANRADVVTIMDAVKALELAGKCYVLSPCRAALELKNSWNEYGYSAF